MRELVVVDACVFLGFALQDYQTHAPAKQAYADAVAKAQLAGEIIIAVPSIALAEIAKGLSMSFEKGRLSQQDLDALCGGILDGAIDQIATPPASIGEYVALKNAYQCQTYDATYLHLAKVRGMALATLDADLETKARRAGVTIWQP